MTDTTETTTQNNDSDYDANGGVECAVMRRDVKRITDYLGGGSGMEYFKGKVFRVTRWSRSRGKSTEIELAKYNSHSPKLKIVLDGHLDFTSDAECASILEPQEIIDMLTTVAIQAEDSGHRSGKLEKQMEIINALGVQQCRSVSPDTLGYK